MDSAQRIGGARGAQARASQANTLMKQLIFAIACASALASPAAAEPAPPPAFGALQRSIDMLELRICPDALARPGVICRMLIGPHRLNVFAIAPGRDGGALVGAASYELDRLDVFAEPARPPAAGRRAGASLRPVD